MACGRGDPNAFYARLWKYLANRQVVACPRAAVRRVWRRHRLLDMGGVPGFALLPRALPLAVLFAYGRPFDRPMAVQHELARLALRADLASAHHPALPARFPADLLLLSQDVLPDLLLRVAGLRGRRIRQARGLSRRDALPLQPPE